MTSPGRLIAEILLLAAWLGAALFFAAAVAPAAFQVLPTRTLAGALVGRTLPVLFISGLVVGGIVIALDLAGGRAAPGIWRTVGASLVVIATFIAQFIVGTRIERVRRSIPGALDALAADDPRRVAFGRLHAMSVGWLGVAMIAAAAALVFAILALRGRS